MMATIDHLRIYLYIGFVAVLSLPLLSEERSDDGSGPRTRNDWQIPDLSLKMRWIPRGKFMMGTDSTGIDTRSIVLDETKHAVVISYDFWISRKETSQKEFFLIMGYKPNKDPHDESPVSSISWKDAMSFCVKLTAIEKRSNRIPDTCQYRLPTEAEWEYCCRAGTKTEFSFGDDVNMLSSHGWYLKNSKKTIPKKRGSKKPNPWGLFDMHGSVYEWCYDSYAPYPKAEVTDPIALTDSKSRILRGGDWLSVGKRCGSSARLACSRPSHRFGFRIVLAPTIESILKRNGKPVGSKKSCGHENGSFKER